MAKSTGRVLPNLEQQELEKLRAENERLKTEAAEAREIRFKVSEKGCLSMYGLGRFPVSLYYEQWKTLLANSDRIHKELEAKKSHLKLRNGD
jgi:hypothetical protein